MAGQVELTQGKGPGQWTALILDEFGDAPTWRAVVRCPECAKHMTLQRGHSIAANGQVSPSVGHPDAYGEPGKTCPWHVAPVLVGWHNPPDPPPRPYNTCNGCGKQSRALGGWGLGANGLVCDQCIRGVATKERTDG